MTDFISVLSTLKSQMSANANRTDILRPLTWLILILLVFILFLFKINADFRLLVASFLFVATIMIIFVMVYLICLFRMPDALRSESYSLQKMAIEQGFFGDNVSGIFLRNNINDSDSPQISVDSKSDGQIK